MPTPCSDGGYTSDRYERYEVDLTEGTLTYDVLIKCKPAQSGKVELTAEENSRLREPLVAMKPSQMKSQPIESCSEDYISPEFFMFPFEYQMQTEGQQIRW